MTKQEFNLLVDLMIEMLEDGKTEKVIKLLKKRVAEKNDD